MSGERPRDRLGRPVTADDPAVDDFAVPGIAGLTDGQIWSLAWTLFTEGRPFHAHEVCEERWRTCAPPDRPLWRALAQWGAAETHLARGNLVGAQRLAERAVATLEGAQERVRGVDTQAVRDRCRQLGAARPITP